MVEGIAAPLGRLAYDDVHKLQPLPAACKGIPTSIRRSKEVDGHKIESKARGVHGGSQKLPLKQDIKHKNNMEWCPIMCVFVWCCH